MAVKAVAGHQGPRSESRGQPLAEVGDPPAQRLEERPVECYTRIPQSRRPVIEMVDVALRSYLLTPVSEPKLTNPEEV
jgi:hypothetical protein